MKFNFKKISAVLASGIMVASGIGLAAAANFPAPFSAGSVTDAAVVYTSATPNLDAAAVSNINDYLVKNVQSGAVGAPTGESFKIEKPSSKLNVGSSVGSVWGTAITKADLPTLLADGSFYNKQNTEYKYSQKIDFGNMNYSFFSDSDLDNRKPQLGVYVASNSYVANYTLNFMTAPESVNAADLTDFEGKNIQVLGKNYYVLDFKNGTTATTKLTLLDAATAGSIKEGDTQTFTMGGKNYEVSTFFITSDQVILTVNGENTEKMSATGSTYGNTYKLTDGTYVGIKNINVQDYQGGIKNVEFSLGTGKLEITDTSNVKINDKTIPDLYGYLPLSTSSTKRTWQKLVLEWKVESEAFLTPSKELVMPGFEAIKFSMTDPTIPNKETTEVRAASSDYFSLKVPIKDGDATIPFLYIDTSTGNFSGIGQSSTQRLRTTNNTVLSYNATSGATQFDGFVASYSNGRDTETYYLKPRMENDPARGPLVTISNKVTGQDVCTQLVTADACNIGSVSLTMDNVSYVSGGDKNITMHINSGGSFYKIYTKTGMTIYLPFTGGNLSSLVKGLINLSVAPTQSDDGFHNGKWTLWMGEADKTGTVDQVPFNFTLDTSSSSSPFYVTIAKADLNLVANNSDFYETPTSGSKVWVGYSFSPLATEVTWDKTNSNQYGATVEYHGSEVYANAYVTAASSTSGEAGQMMFTDAEKTAWSGRNVVLVGGSCVNTATAEALGVTANTCGDEFAAQTGVGPGQFMIQVLPDKFTTGKVALVVAGYELADTSAAASTLIGGTSSIDTSKAGKYVGTTSAGYTVTAA
jgi:hypothetical protein